MIVCRLLALATVFALPLFSSAQFPDHCDHQKPLPFAGIEKHHPIDDACGINGKPSSPDPTHLQNAAKNNFCSEPSGGAPESMTLQQFADLQHSHNFPAGQGMEPSDRTPLRNAGEGKVVRVKAYLIEAHHADLGGGESVNCNRPNEEDNDIHIALGATPNAKECTSISAEISPHFRPVSWNEIGHFEKWNPTTNQYTVNNAMASRLRSHAYRITGQLFYDASHAPCPCGTQCSPVRAAVWEIHPVYGIEVCKAGTKCEENSDADWMPFDTWWNSLVPIQPVKPPHSHHPHEKKSSTAKTKTN